MRDDGLESSDVLRARFGGMPNERLKDLLKQSYLKGDSRQIIRGILQSRGVDEDTQDLTEAARDAARTVSMESRLIRRRRPGSVTAVAAIVALCGFYIVAGTIVVVLAFTKDSTRHVVPSSYRVVLNWPVIALMIAIGIAHFVVAAGLMDGRPWALHAWRIGTPLVLLAVALTIGGGGAWAIDLVAWLASLFILRRQAARSYFAPGVIRSRYGAIR